ncbi:hypothetical protein AKJ09_03901 [Labilithrix luteola]|uniref:Lipoprotein n=1 Tax=Labilithrix luteola TaxID=1391654 RepID=A0A0K1PUP3_9BACT|nr:hypothetical protein [Labilithrix luteola]AKU97237.1 hypothetical protein AKJ09_03901 [Labilithrix luteola]
MLAVFRLATSRFAKFSGFPILPVLAAAVALGGCDDKAASSRDKAPAASASSVASVVTPPSAAPPAPASPPQLAIYEGGASVGGERIDFTAPDPKGRLAAALSGKPIAGEEIVVDAARNNKTPQVALVFAALSEAKAKSARIRTPKRDRSNAEITFPLGVKRPDCTVVGFIGKDVSINVWPVSGGTAQRYAKGMAGPDITLGSAGVRKQLATCDSPVWAVSSDDSVQWGLVVDLVLGVMHPEEGPPPAGNHGGSVVLLTKPPVPGRKVEND